MKNKSQEIIFDFISNIFTKHWIEDFQNLRNGDPGNIPHNSIFYSKKVKEMELDKSILDIVYMISFFSFVILFASFFFGKNLPNQQGWVVSLLWASLFLIILIKIIRNRIKRAEKQVGEIGKKLARDWDLFLKKINSTRIKSILKDECNFEKVSQDRLLISLETVFSTAISRILAEIEKYRKNEEKDKLEKSSEELLDTAHLADVLKLKAWHVFRKIKKKIE